MTNEQLAELISGGKRELIPMLWERIERIAYYISNKWYRSHAELCSKRGVEAEDIRQTSYIAFLKSVSDFDPGKDFKFATYLKFPILNEIKKLLGDRNDVLNNCQSLDKPLTADSDNEHYTAVSLLFDDTVQEKFERVEVLADNFQILHEAIEKLPPKSGAIIKMRCLEGKTLKECSEILGVTSQRVQQSERHSYRLLRQNQELKEFATE